MCEKQHYQHTNNDIEYDIEKLLENWDNVRQTAKQTRIARKSDLFRLGRWVKVQGLVKAAELNGCIAEIIDIDDKANSGRVNIQCYGNDYQELKKAAIKLENCLPFLESECAQSVRIQSKGETEANYLFLYDLLVPKVVIENLYSPHATNCPVPTLCGFPLNVVKVSPFVKLRDRADYDNQWTTYMMIDRYTGFAPMSWQAFIGPVIVFRPIKYTTTGKEFPPVSCDDMALLNDYLNEILDLFGEKTEVDPSYFTPSRLQKFKQCTVRGQSHPSYNMEKYVNLNI